MLKKTKERGKKDADKRIKTRRRQRNTERRNEHEGKKAKEDTSKEIVQMDTFRKEEGKWGS